MLFGKSFGFLRYPLCPQEERTLAVTDHTRQGKCSQRVAGTDLHVAQHALDGERVESIDGLQLFQCNEWSVKPYVFLKCIDLELIQQGEVFQVTAAGRVQVERMVDIKRQFVKQ